VKALLIGVLIGLGAGLGWGWWRGRVAETRAVRADSLYQVAKASEALFLRERRASALLHQREQQVADSTAKAADAALDAAHARVLAADQRAAARIKAATTVAEERDVYRSLYQETITERDNALLAAEDQRRAAGRFKALAADTTQLWRERQRGDRWKETADSLAAANADLLKHRGMHLEIGGAKGFVAGGLVVEVIRLVATGRL
jgi:predicted negative regulator of RcsB-dependent stress response